MRDTERTTSSVSPTDSDAETSQKFAADMQRIVAHAHERSPAGKTWGLFSYDDGPAAIGGGCGAFLWFDSHREMIDFIGSYLPFWSAGPCRHNPADMIGEVRDILAQMCSESQPNTELIRTRLNQAIKGYARLLWWGRFEELLLGSKEFAREVRHWFRSSRMSEQSDAAIADDEREEFTQAIQEYGL